MSKKELDRLGDRLRDAAVPSEEDLRVLEAVRAEYRTALERVRSVLGSMKLEHSHREKNRDTILEKLRREKDMRLSRVQDVVGARVVRDMTLAEQNDLVRELADHFPDHRLRDRRKEPSHGYRAVHLIVKLDGLPVEIQVRTELQHVWAQTMERLGDRWGRQIRYGGEPNEPEREHRVLESGAPRSRRSWVDLVKDLASSIAADEQGQIVSVIQVPGAPGHWTARSLLDSLQRMDL